MCRSGGTFEGRRIMPNNNARAVMFMLAATAIIAGTMLMAKLRGGTSGTGAASASDWPRAVYVCGGGAACVARH